MGTGASLNNNAPAIGGGGSIPGSDTGGIYILRHILNGTSQDMVVNGSVTPVEFSAGPAAGEIYYIQSIELGLEDSGNNDIDKFGALAALTNGLKLEWDIGGSKTELHTLKTNFDIMLHFSEDGRRGQANAFLNSNTFYTGKIHFPFPVALVGDDTDEFLATVSDDLTGLDKFEIALKILKVVP